MGLTASPGLAAGLEGAVNAFYQGQDAQRAQQMENAQFNTQQQMNAMQLRQFKAGLDASGGQIIWRGLKTGNLQEAEKEHNDLFPDDPIKIAWDQNDPKGDTALVTDKDGQSHQVKLSMLDSVYNVAGQKYAAEAGIQRLKNQGAAEVADIKANGPQHIGWGGLAVPDGKGGYKVISPAGNGNGRARGSAQAEYLQYIANNVTGGDVGKALSLVKSNPQQLAMRLYNVEKNSLGTLRDRLTDQQVWDKVNADMQSLQQYGGQLDHGGQNNDDAELEQGFNSARGAEVNPADPDFVGGYNSVRGLNPPAAAGAPIAPAAGASPQLPAEAIHAIKSALPGTVTHFRNGTAWKWENGQPVRVQ